MLTARAKPDPWTECSEQDLPMDLSTEIFRTRGRAAKPVSAAVVRALDEADLSLLADEKGSVPAAVKRLSERHHALARNLAGGMAPSEAAIVCGYSLSRVSILQDDPAFKELLHFYREDVKGQYRDLHTRLAGIAADALDVLQDRLEEQPEDLSVGQLIELSKMGADRTGFGPQTSQTNLNVNIDLASRLEAARKRVRERVIEG